MTSAGVGERPLELGCLLDTELSRPVVQRAEVARVGRVERHLCHRDHDQPAAAFPRLVDGSGERPLRGLFVVVTDDDRVCHGGSIAELA